ncbi:TetR family transcriptional regulator [Streptomyces sp. CA-253872]|uniref:TetR family transcriptional regulator n=1 Tax=Streptomyces sp. CA-253872 TaxID=3240067 RepID=UPI003D89BCB6
MAWNTEETRRRLKEAAVREFAATGLSGTRIESIAARAGINKERIYNYFGSKEKLFSLVLADELARIAAAVPLEMITSAGIGEFAGACFDYHVQHPELVRLLHWEALEFTERRVPDEDVRREHYQQKVAALAAAQRSGTLAAEPAAADAVFMILALCAWWVAVPQVARMIAGTPHPGAPEMAARRAAVALAAERMVVAPSPR